MTKTIFINGPARVGKDTVAQMIEDTYGGAGYSVYQFKVSAMIKQILAMIMQLPPEDVERFKDAATTVNPERTFRDILVQLSDEVIKPHFGDHYQGAWCAKRILEQCPSHNHLAVVSDSGFQIEADAMFEILGQHNCYVITIERSDCEWGDKDAREIVNHPQESHNFHIKNDRDLDHLKSRVAEILQIIELESQYGVRQ